MKRKASAVWTGGIKDGRGRISTDSGVLARYTVFLYAHASRMARAPIRRS